MYDTMQNLHPGLITHLTTFVIAAGIAGSVALVAAVRWLLNS